MVGAVDNAFAALTLLQSRLLRRWVVVAGLMTLAFAVSSKAQDSGPPTAELPTTQDEAAMVVFLREFTFDRGKADITDEDRIVECIQSAIRASASRRRIVSYDEFRAIAFPDLGRNAAPRRPEYLGILLRQPEFRARIAPLRIRHIIFVGGATLTSGAKGGGICGFGDRAGGCLGLVYWDKRSELAATIVDVTGRHAPSSVRSAQSGTAWLAIIVLVPLGMPAFTESAACSDVGSRVARALPAVGR